MLQCFTDRRHHFRPQHRPLVHLSKHHSPPCPRMIRHRKHDPQFVRPILFIKMTKQPQTPKSPACSGALFIHATTTPVTCMLTPQVNRLTQFRNMQNFTTRATRAAFSFLKSSTSHHTSNKTNTRCVQTIRTRHPSIDTHLNCITKPIAATRKFMPHSFFCRTKKTYSPRHNRYLKHNRANQRQEPQTPYNTSQSQHQPRRYTHTGPVTRP